MLRKFTRERELVRASVTRFATAYLTLLRIHKQKTNLRKMFTLEDWTTSKWAKEAIGKRAIATILMPTFWTSIVYKLRGRLLIKIWSGKAKIWDASRTSIFSNMFVKFIWPFLKKSLMTSYLDCSKYAYLFPRQDKHILVFIDKKKMTIVSSSAF